MLCSFGQLQDAALHKTAIVRPLASHLSNNLSKLVCVLWHTNLCGLFIAKSHLYIIARDTKILWAILNKSWRQHPTKQQLYGHLPPITKTIKIKQTRHVGHCGRSRDELISDVHLWTPSHGRAKAGQPAQTYIQQLCVDTGCSSEDLLEAMDDREGRRERVRNIRADGATWLWKRDISESDKI